MLGTPAVHICTECYLIIVIRQGTSIEQCRQTHAAVLVGGPAPAFRPALRLADMMFLPGETFCPPARPTCAVLAGAPSCPSIRTRAQIRSSLIGSAAQASAAHPGARQLSVRRATYQHRCHVYEPCATKPSVNPNRYSGFSRERLQLLHSDPSFVLFGFAAALIARPRE